MSISRQLRLLCALLAVAAPAHAHLGSKDVYQTVDVAPYTLYATIRPPNVIPGVATVEVRSSGAPITSLSVTPLPVTGEASRHPPAPDVMQRSAVDPSFFTGAVWMMSSGTWQIRFQIAGAAGSRQASVPVVAVPITTLHMQPAMGVILALLGLFLIITLIGIVAASVRESQLVPGAPVTPVLRRRGLIAAISTLVLVAAIVYLGGQWWNVEAANYSDHIYRAVPLRADLQGNQLHLIPGQPKPLSHKLRVPPPAGYLLDHGKVMHLYAIRQPSMDAAFHLHPTLLPDGTFTLTLPAMPPGSYRLYGDIVHAGGFPETLLATVDIPPGMPGTALDPEDASASPPPLSAGELGTNYKLPDHYTLVWDRPPVLTAATPYTFRFQLLDPTGKPATGMQPYLGMAGHAAFVKTDGTVFAHTHPDGSAAMPDVMLANASLSGNTASQSMDMSQAGPISSQVGFPYGFPTPGRYRIFVQMKHADTVETGVFDAEVK